MICSESKKVDSITFEEEVDGELVMTTVNLEQYEE